MSGQRSTDTLNSTRLSDHSPDCKVIGGGAESPALEIDCCLVGGVGVFPAAMPAALLSLPVVGTPASGAAGTGARVEGENQALSDSQRLPLRTPRRLGAVGGQEVPARRGSLHSSVTGRLKFDRANVANEIALIVVIVTVHPRVTDRVDVCNCVRPCRRRRSAGRPQAAGSARYRRHRMWYSRCPRRGSRWMC
jgi:hypothetical protein